MRAVREILSYNAKQHPRETRATWTIREALDWTTRHFRENDVDPARFEAEELLAHAMQCERLVLYLRPNRTLGSDEQARFRGLVEQRAAGTPSAYLVGRVEFMQTKLTVNPAVLIPRVETEQLVERIVKDFAEQGDPQNETLRLLDLGTGSGAIAIALLCEWPNARAVAADISAAALEIAGANAAANGVSERLSLVRSDWAASVDGPFDLMVANPPYVASDELKDLPREVSGHEPLGALDGGPAGTREIERILRDAPRLLGPGRPIYLEIGHDQGVFVRELVLKTRQLTGCQVFQDHAGQDHIVRAYRSEG